MRVEGQIEEFASASGSDNMHTCVMERSSVATSNLGDDHFCVAIDSDLSPVARHLLEYLEHENPRMSRLPV